MSRGSPPCSPTTAPASAATCARSCAPSSRTARPGARERSTQATASSPNRSSGWRARRAHSGDARTAFFSGRNRPHSGQFLFYPPSVFNYFPPDYVVPGTDATGPEFGILTTSTAIARANFATALVFPPAIPPDPTVYGATGTALDFGGWLASTADPGALAQRLDRELLAGRMPAAMRSAIVSAVNAVPASDPLGRAKTAAWLVLTSPHYQVER
ncbi:MAG: DUF1800 family protein [Betaproteobacteria bacterium]|nr:DUF1800 family protein [Betaproteobacteria bacterium]